jgi:hypothetical protein
VPEKEISVEEKKRCDDITDALIEKFDTNSDGKINKEEFGKAFAAMRDFARFYDFYREKLSDVRWRIVDWL